MNTKDYTEIFIVTQSHRERVFVFHGDAFCYEMADCGLYVERQRVIPLRYKSHPLKAAYRADLIVGGLYSLK